LILALIGAGSKAGIVPLHAWLPLAHPAAPSHVSALMSGVMTKVAVYGFVRIAFELAGPPAWWWSVIVLALAGTTTVMGVLYALMQHDLKRLSHGREYRHHLHWARARARLRSVRHEVCRRAGVHGGVAARVQSLSVQEPAVLRLRRRAGRNRRARHGASWRGPSSHAADPVCVSFGVRCHRGFAAAQWLRLRVADVPGDFAQPAIAVVGAEVFDSCRRRALGALRRACRCLFRQGLRGDVSGPFTQPRRHSGGRDRRLFA